MRSQFVCFLLLSLPLVYPARAQDYPPLQREPVLDATIPAANPPISLVHGARIQFAPKQPTGLHRHPVSVVGVVTEGSFIFQPEGEPARTIKAGDSFFEPAGKTILHFDNASPTKKAAIIAFYLTDSNSRPLIEPLEK
ncbi:cupin domain-containing protein [Silvibacterium acidisoli]|uniref:cupin domain-containing protein n=1 Tax=Acidobacteriaceae bacterium ZG23-2 TaxID=2883246 RepID=UPI00406C1975